MYFRNIYDIIVILFEFTTKKTEEESKQNIKVVDEICIYYKV